MGEKGSQGDCVHVQGCALLVATSEAAHCREIDFTELVQSNTKQICKQQAQGDQYQGCYNILPKYLSFQQTNYKTWKEIGKCDQYTGKKIRQQNCLLEGPELDIAEKDIKVPIINMFN